MPGDEATEALSEPGWLNRCLAAGGVWAHGRIESVGVERIGLGFGLSGEVRRLHCATDAHDHVTLVAKLDGRELVGRAVDAHHVLASHLGRSKPTLLGQDVESFDELGVLLLEDIRPAEQGDELRPVDQDRARGLVSVVARVHRTPIDAPGVPTLDRWTPRAPDPEQWYATLAMLDPQLDRRLGRRQRVRLERLDADAAAMAEMLAQQPFVLLHRDPHLDNVLWRPDGSPVLLDWSSARLGPVAVDVATLLSSLCFTDRPSLHPDEVIDALAEPGDPVRVEAARAAVTNLIRGQLGWAGRPDAAAAHPRVEALLDDAFGRIERAIGWLDFGVVSGRSRT